MKTCNHCQKENESVEDYWVTDDVSDDDLVLMWLCDPCAYLYGFNPAMWRKQQGEVMAYIEELRKLDKENK
jgi:hypothetical protein